MSRAYPTLETMRYFHGRILPGIELRESAEVKNQRSRVYLGMATLAGLAAIGAILMVVGIAGIVAATVSIG